MDKTIFISGGNGFIGSNLVHALLKRGVKPHVLLKSLSESWRIESIKKDIHVHCGDLRDRPYLDAIIKEVNPKIILHTAIYGGYVSQQDEKNIYDTNFLGAINLLKACAAVDYELFVNTGSSSEYGIKDSAIKEADVLEPLTDYGVSKAAASMYCRSLALREKRPVITLRLFSPFGYYEAAVRLIPSVITACLRDKNPRVSSPDSVRDFIFVEDLVDAYLKAIDKKDNLRGEILNVGSGRQHTVQEMVDIIISLCGKNVQPEWKAVQNPRIEPAVWQADISKTKKILGWEPKFSLRSGLEKTVKWFQDNLEFYK